MLHSHDFRRWLRAAVVPAPLGGAWGCGRHTASTSTSPASAPAAPTTAAAFAPVTVSPTLLAGRQPTAAELGQLAKDGVRVVVDLRGEGEDRGFDEAATVRAEGMRYVSIPITAPKALDAAALTTFREATGDEKTYVHCASGQRAGAFVATLLADGGMPTDEALAIGTTVGLSRWHDAVAAQLGATKDPKAP